MQCICVTGNFALLPVNYLQLTNHWWSQNACAVNRTRLHRMWTFLITSLMRHLYYILLNRVSDVRLLISLPRDAAQSAVMPQYVVWPSVRLSLWQSAYVCLSVTFRYRDHIGWNSWKIISPLNSLRLLLGMTPIRVIGCNGNTPKIRVE